MFVYFNTHLDPDIDGRVTLKLILIRNTVCRCGMDSTRDRVLWRDVTQRRLVVTDVSGHPETSVTTTLICNIRNGTKNVS
jgi:hypothetical protein